MPTAADDTLAQRAERLATKLTALVRLVQEREGADLVHVSSDEICRAMGKPQGATLHEVKQFVQLVLEHLQGRGSEAACGCGLLSLQVGRTGFMDRAVAEDRDLTTFVPDDIESYLLSEQEGAG